MSFAIGIIVKTPGLSPLKTRLAQTIGVERAERVFHLSLSALASELSSALTSEKLGKRLHPYWAVHEKGAVDGEYWQRLAPQFGRFWQGEGELGSKLDQVYRQLHIRHGVACVIGGDTPHIMLEDLIQLNGALESHNFVIGPSRDGGFYLMAGNKSVPKDVWEKVPYSSETTASCLAGELEAYGKVAMLGLKQDIDYQSDLPQLLVEVAELRLNEHHPLHALVNFCRELI